MFLVQGLISIVLGIVTFWWMVDFPENAHRSCKFLTKEESAIAAARIQRDRGDVKADKFALGKVLRHAGDPKVYGFCAMYFLLNLVSTSLSYFLPIILQGGMGFSSNQAILLSAPPYYYAVIPVILSSWVSDKYRLRGPVITFNSVCLIVGFCMLGFANQVTVRYVGTYLATGAYIANWAALAAYYGNNITGQWKRVFTAAAVTACNGAGGIAGSFIVRQPEAPRYVTAVWVSIGYAFSNRAGKSSYTDCSSSHLLMIAFVAAFSFYFYLANKRQQKGKSLIEGTVSIRALSMIVWADMLTTCRRASVIRTKD